MSEIDPQDLTETEIAELRECCAPVLAESVLAALTAAAAERSLPQTWLPIETAPKRRWIVVGCWVGKRWSSWTVKWDGTAHGLGCDGEYGDEPTHWTILAPPPPTPETQG